MMRETDLECDDDHDGQGSGIGVHMGVHSGRGGIHAYRRRPSRRSGSAWLTSGTSWRATSSTRSSVDGSNRALPRTESLVLLEQGWWSLADSEGAVEAPFVAIVRSQQDAIA